jgi:hypothetical protein
VLTVDPTQNLLPSTHYYLDLVSGSVQDIAGNSYAGTTAYDFTTGNISPVATGSFGGHYYEVYAEKYTWTDAQAVAKQKGGYLVSITSSAENTFVANLRPSSLSPWIGLYQADFTNEPAGGWVWDSGEVSTYRAWAPGEPNNDFGIEGYAHFFTTPFSFYGWNDFIQSGGVPPLTRTNVAAVGFLVEYGSVLPPTTTTPGLRVIGLNEQFERVAEFGALTSHRLSGPRIGTSARSVSGTAFRSPPGRRGAARVRRGSGPSTRGSRALVRARHVRVEHRVGGSGAT